MNDYYGIETILNTINGMQVIRDNIKNDDGVDELPGASWFTYLGNTIGKIYINGNSGIGFGSNSCTDLKVCNRDGAVYSLYWQEGTIFKVINFLKIRWDGYTRYNSTSTDCKLVYELFVLSNGIMFINVITAPSSSYIGTSLIRSISGNKSITINAATTTTVKLNWMDNECEISYEDIIVDKPYASKYIIKCDDLYYTQIEDKLSEIPITTLDRNTFLEHGCDSLDFNLIKDMRNPELYYFIDSEDYQIDYNLICHAVPKEQKVITIDYDITDESIAGIESVTLDCSDTVLFSISIDHGDTFLKYDTSAWVTISDDDDGMTKELLETLTFDDFAYLKEKGCYRLKFTIKDNESVNKILFSYRNEV